MVKSSKVKTSKHELIRRMKQLLKKYFKDKEEIKAAYLYGSIVIGRDLKDSDVDIALLTTPYKDHIESYKARVKYHTDISRLIKKDVDLVFLQEVGELLAFQILREGKVIFERDRNMHRSFRATRLIQCLDYQFLENRMQKGMIAAMRRSVIGQ
ncbi:MAG: nucleotidyltransferase [Candidatus Scalindua rubra]|uniref:Nucleotidyltransferase n=1 Tax=Candidatus Scalindua rubra TaxID=1872076 RepID=A0A1E3XFU3_9BACT|nr:MAG: nucleotidyltransferase [Candidatus Scalindua rubra]